MCITVGMAAMLAMGASTAVAVYGQQQQGKAMKRQGRSQQEWANYQAEQNLADAQAERDQAMVQADLIRKKARAVRGSAAVANAASGVKLNDTGTVGAIDESITIDAETDALNAILTGKRRGQTLHAQAHSNRAAGENAMASGNNARRAANYESAATVLGAAGSAAKGWKTMQQERLQSQLH